jgi:hypothetical protein
MTEQRQYIVESEATAHVLGLYPAFITLLSALLINWGERNPMHTISGMLLVAGAYSSFRAFQSRYRKFEKVADTKAIGYWIYGSSVALVALLASTTFRSAIWLLLTTAVVMYFVLRKGRFPVVTPRNKPPADSVISP